MAKREARRVRRELTPEEQKRWERAVRESDAERDKIIADGRAALAARRAAHDMLGKLKAERERRGLSLADMMRLTGMSRESISRLENDPSPNPTVLTFARYATALGLELNFSVKRGG
jgi:DNA-binding XRE family transcriptional regulator